MALVDRNRRYVEVNDATLELYSYDRDEVIGQRAGRTATDGDSDSADVQWMQLLRTNELYGERTVGHPSGTPMRVSYAAHGSVMSGRWLALFVTLSAHFEPDGAELIQTSKVSGSAESEGAGRNGPVLTPREREVVRRVALGASTRQIAADLYLSPATVRSHVRNAMVKTNAHTRAQLVAIVLGDVLNGGEP
jgi:DNA-binding CsgD family transcriptional regulator